MKEIRKTNTMSACPEITSHKYSLIYLNYVSIPLEKDF